MAKKANKPFLILLTLGILVLVVGGVFGIKWIRAHRRGDPAKLIEAANVLLADKRADEAAAKFWQASQLAPADPLPVSRMGDALYELSKSEPEFLAKAMAQWNSALQMDPNFKPALRSKLDAFIDDMEAYQRPDTFNNVRDIAARLAKLDPSDTHAVSYQYIATLSAWMNNRPTEPDKIKEAMDGLRSLAKADPADATMPYQVARGLIQQAQDEGRMQNNPTLAMQHYNEAAKLMDDAVNQQPGNVMMLLRAGQIYAILDILIPQGGFNAQAGTYLDRARSLVRPDDKNFQEVYTVYASRKLQRGEQAEAEKVYRELLQKKPDDVPVRLVLAEILQASRSSRKEAAELLTRTIADCESPKASRTAISRALYLRALLRLSSVQMDLLEDITDPAAYKTLMAQIEANVAKTESKMPENAESLKIHGRLYLIKGETQKAVTTLNKAVQMLDQVAAQSDNELLYTLARAELMAQQNEDAKKLLRKVVQAFRTFTPARALLVDVLLNSNEMAEAATHIDELDKQLPGSPLVARFRILTLDPKKDKTQIDRLFSVLPQDTRAQMLEKARIAVIIDRLDVAIALMEAARGLDPRDIRVADRLARLYLYKNDRERAKKILDEALLIAPKDAELQILRKRIDNATPNDLIDLVRTIIEGNSDPLSREIQMADLERLRGNAPALYTHLIAAEKIAPSDPRVQESLFTYYLATRQWDAAAKYIDPLTKINYGGSQGLIYRWKLAVAKNDLPTAVAVGREFTQRMPEFATSWITLGQALKLSGQYDEALRCYLAAREHQSANRDAIRGAIDCYYALNQPLEAKKIIDSARQLYPTDLSLAEMELEYELEHGDPKKAMAPILGDLQREPEQVVHYLNAASMYYRMSRQSGTPAEQADYMAKGINVLKTAVAKFPDEMQPYVNLAELQSINNDRAAAEATLKALTVQPTFKDSPQPKLVLAEFYAKGNQPEKAEQPLRDAVANAPASLEIRRKLAVYLSQQNRVDDALTALDAAPGKLSLDPVLLTSRLEILVAAGRFTDAEASAVQALLIKPNEPNWLAIQANAQSNQQKYDAAIATAEKALAIDPKNSRALITRAMAKLNRPGGDLNDAAHDLEAFRDQYPTDNNVRRLLADAYQRMQRPDDADRELEAGLRNAPGDRQVRTTLLDYYRTAQPPRWSEGDMLLKDAQSVDSLMKDPEWHATEAAWLVNRKQGAQAIEKIKLAMTLAPKEKRYVQTYLSVLLQTKNESLLLSDTDAMLVADPNRWWIYQARGLARKAMGNVPGAEQEFGQALSTAIAQKDVDAAETIVATMSREVGVDKTLQIIQPHLSEDVRYVLMAASLSRQKKDSAGAIKFIESAMTQVDSATPENQTRILSTAGTIYSTATPPLTDKAIAVYQRLIKLQPDNVEALNQLAWMLAVDVSPAQPQQALTYSTRAYQLASSASRFSPSILDTHGWVLVLCGKLEDGVMVLKKVVDLAPTIESRYHLGEAYNRLGKFPEAKTQLDAAQELIDSSVQNKRPVDPTLKQAIDTASEAVKMKLP